MDKIWDSVRDFMVQYPLFTAFDHFLDTKTGQMVFAAVAMWIMSAARWMYKKWRGLNAPVALFFVVISTITITALVIFLVAINSEPSQSSQPPASTEANENRGVVITGKQSGGNNVGGNQYNYNYENAPSPSATPSPTAPLTLEELFDTDFPYANIGRALPMGRNTNGPAEVVIKSRLFLDFDARSEILSLYVPYQIDPNLAFTMARGMASHVAEIVDPNSDVNKQVEQHLSLSHPGESVKTPLSELRFSGRVYLYLENDPTDAQKALIESRYRSRDLVVEIRGLDWESLHMNDKRPLPLPAHLGTDFYRITYTLPSSQASAQGDKLEIRMRVLANPTPTK